MVVLRFLTFAAALAYSSSLAIAASTLNPPFDVESARAVHGAAAGLFHCKAPPKPQRDLDFSGVYQRGTNSSVVDEKGEHAYRIARKTVDDFQKGVIRTSDRYVASKPAQGELAACVLTWLDTWAKSGAMLGSASQQGGYVRKWTLGTVSVAYLKVRDAEGLDAAMKKRVVTWIRDWAAIVREDYSTGMERGSRNNNHSYWAGWSVLAAGIVLNDRSHFDWAQERYRNGLAQLENDGTLPLEMDRRTRALHYHLFSIPPLVMIAETAARNGIDLYGSLDGAIHRLIRRTLSGIDDPSYFSNKSGYKQAWGGKFNASKMAWGAVYQARFPIPALKRLLGRFGRIYDTRLGGNMTVLFAPRAK